MLSERDSLKNLTARRARCLLPFLTSLDSPATLPGGYCDSRSIEKASGKLCLTHPGPPCWSGAEPASGARVLWLWLSFWHKVVQFIFNSTISASNAYQRLHGTTTHYGAKVAFVSLWPFCPESPSRVWWRQLEPPAVVMQTLEEYTKAFA